MKVYVIAGELSGDKLGAALMSGLLQLHGTDIEFRGVGGPLMAQQGLSSQFPMTELSVMGLVEILPKYFDLKRRIQECVDAILAWQPDVVITIDSPDFCLRVAKAVREKSQLRTVHYVAPSVWAWRPGRAAKMAPFIDQVLALLPFEPPYMTAHGMRCDFVGHPVVAEPLPTPDAIQSLKAELGIDGPTCLILPGSRRSEVSRLLPVFVQTMERLQAQRPDLNFVLPAAGPVASLVKDLTANMAAPPTILDASELSADQAETRKRAAFAMADVALAVSGTVSLELAAAGTPMVIAYDVNVITREIMKRLLKIDTLTLANLVTDTREIPEFLGKDCIAEKIAPSLLQLLDAPETQQEILSETMRLLGRDDQDPGLRAAAAVLDGLSD
ncbi:lipid-A-disaccharide synthase [Cognatishimia sp. WU-CL00825]|uniref:lipid-A-disaccharide synthase n=1 Tax=Cognatishimia sp. WU-CL00825 TaxID=3127658 RepID=UPI003102F70B